MVLSAVFLFGNYLKTVAVHLLNGSADRLLVANCFFRGGRAFFGDRILLVALFGDFSCALAGCYTKNVAIMSLFGQFFNRGIDHLI